MVLSKQDTSYELEGLPVSIFLTIVVLCYNSSACRTGNPAGTSLLSNSLCQCMLQVSTVQRNNPLPSSQVCNFHPYTQQTLDGITAGNSVATLISSSCSLLY